MPKEGLSLYFTVKDGASPTLTTRDRRLNRTNRTEYPYFALLQISME